MRMMMISTMIGIPGLEPTQFNNFILNLRKIVMAHVFSIQNQQFSVL